MFFRAGFFPLMTLAAALSACGPSGAPPVTEPRKSTDVISYPPGADELSSLRVVTVTISPLPVSADLNSRLALDESVTARVGSPVSGRVTRLLADLNQFVRSGEALAYIDSPDVGQARADVLTAQAQSRQKAEELSRSRLLFEGEAISRREFEAAQANATGANVELQRAQLRLRSLGAGAGDTLPLSTTVSGYVIDRQINSGQQVSPGQGPLFTVSDARQLWLLVDLPEDAAPRARLGEQIEFDVAAWPNRHFYGKITKIGLSVDPGTRRVQLRAQVSNSDLALRPEMYARARLVTDDGRRAIRVPNKAIFEAGRESFVFREEAPGRFRRVPVEVSERGDTYAFITAGLKNGDRIVGEGALLLNAQLSGG